MLNVTAEMSTTETVITIPEKVILNLVCSLGLLASCFLNGSVLLTVVKNPTLRQKLVYILLICQSVCDILTPFLYVPSVAFFSLVDSARLGEVLAFAQRATLQLVGVYLPLHIMTLLALERAIFICKPFKYDTYFTLKKVYYYLGLVLGVNLIILIASAFIDETLQNRTVLAARPDSGLMGNAPLALVLIAFYVVLPTGSQIICFVAISRVAVKQSRSISAAAAAVQTVSNDAEPSHTPRGPSKSTLQTVAAITRLCGIYWVTWFPCLVFFSVHTSAANRGKNYPFLHFATRYMFVAVMTLVPAVNPIICIRNIAELRIKWLQLFGIRRVTEGTAWTQESSMNGL